MEQRTQGLRTRVHGYDPPAASVARTAQNVPREHPLELRAEWAVNRRQILLASTMNLSAYLLVLFAFRLSKTGYVVAARELLIVLSAVIGSVWLDEGPIAPLLLGSAAVLAGVACIAAA